MDNIVEEYYDSQTDAEWLRLERHRLEFEITKRALDEYINCGVRVLDIGGGPGRYSIHLAGRGCRVSLLDLSAQNIARANTEAVRAGVALELAVHGNALDIERTFSGQQFDAVLCMGPLYHLQDETDRAAVACQCANLLKPGGIFIASFISAYAPILDSLRRYPESIEGSAQRYLEYFEDGRNFAEEGFTDAWFAKPLEIETFMKRFPLEKIALLAAEGLGILVEPALVALPEEQFMRWVDLFYTIARNSEIHGACEHLLYIGRKNEL